MKNRFRGVATMLAIALILLLVGAVLIGGAAHPVAAAPALQTNAPRTITLYGPTAVTTGTTYSAAPLTATGGDDLARITNYKQVDLFVATDANSSGSVTVTLQASPDATIWADATNIVQTFNVSGTLSSNTYTYTKVLVGGSATGMLSAPLFGEFIRIKVAVTGAVTPTVKATLR